MDLSIGGLFNDLLSKLGTVNGGSASPQGNQASQPAQPSNYPSPGVASAGGVPDMSIVPQDNSPQVIPNMLGADPQQQAMGQPQGPSQVGGQGPQPIGKGTADYLKYLLPVALGIGGAMQRPRRAGTSTGIGMGLTEGLPALMQMMQQDQQAGIEQQKLKQEYGFKQQELGQQERKIGIDQQQADYTTKPMGQDITANVRNQNAELDKALPSSELMAGMPMDAQQKFLQSAITLSDTKAKLAETHDQHEASNDLKSQLIDQHAQASQQMFDLKSIMIQNQLTEHQERMGLLQQQINDAKIRGDRGEEYKNALLDLKRSDQDLKKQLSDAKIDNDNANRLVKARSNYDAHMHLPGALWGLTWEDYSASIGIDPSSGATVKVDSGKPSGAAKPSPSAVPTSTGASDRVGSDSRGPTLMPPSPLGEP